MRKLQKQQDKRKTQKQILSRMTALLVGLACCLTMVLGQGQVVKAAPVIDTTKNDCTITIHKYEYNGGTNPTPTPVAGNGEAGQTVPVGATALDDVGFTLYVLNDYDTADEIKAYYSSSNTTTLEPTSYYTYNSTTDTYTANIGSGTGEVTQIQTGTTAGGVLTFSNLPVGIYLVVETGAPAKVTKKEPPFLVSIPMTKPTGDGWNYDVHVYPKNKTTVAGVKLKKTDTTGTIALDGAHFVLQVETATPGEYQTVDKDANGTAIGVTVEGINHVLTTQSGGLIEVNNLAPGNYRFVEVGVGTNYGYIMDGSKSYPFKVDANGKILDTSDNVINTDPHITVKNEKPDVEKKVLKKGGDVNTPSDWVDDANYSIGDTVTYQVIVDVPSNVASLKEFKIKDTPSGIKYYSIVSVEYDKGVGYIPLTENTHYTLATVGDGFELSLNSDGRTAVSNTTGSKIRIRYEATVQNTAVSTTSGNTNKVDLIYEDKILPASQADGNPNPTANPTDPNSKHTIEDKTVVYTVDLTINKEDAANSGTKLKGVKFTLYEKNSAGDVEASALGLSGTGKYKKLKEDITTNDDGQAILKGLSAGEYCLVETQTIAPYNLLSKAVKLTVSVDGKATWSTKSDAAETIKKDTITPGAEMKLDIDDKGATTTLTVTIKNSKGFTLPKTGGAGGFLLTVIGCGVMILGIVLFHKSRDNKKEEAA